MEYIQGLPERPPVDLQKIYPNATPLALDLMKKMLTFTAKKRISVDDALSHPYFQALHNPAYEPVAEQEFDASFETSSLDKKVIQDLMFEEVYSFRPQIKATDPRGPAYRAIHKGSVPEKKLVKRLSPSKEKRGSTSSPSKEKRGSTEGK